MPFFVAIALALVLTWAARRLGLATGLVDRPPGPRPGDDRPPGAEHLKIHTVPIPVLGGLGVVAAVLGGLLVAGADLPVGAVAGVVLATAIGLVDDARPQPASVRVVALAVAGLPIAAGLPLDELGWPARTGAVLLLLLLANAVNLIDGQDGLAGGLGAIASVGLAGRGVGDIKVVVGAANQGANRFYAKVGFREAGRLTVHQGTPSNVWIRSCRSSSPSPSPSS